MGILTIDVVSCDGVEKMIGSLNALDLGLAVSRDPLSQACEIAHIAGFNEGELEWHDKFIDSVISERTLFQERERQGVEKGKVEGRIERRMEGIEIGKVEEKRVIAKNLITLSLTNQQIAEATGLSIEEIQALRQNHNHI